MAETTPKSASPTCGRRLILCFDGTGNKFGETNSNVVRFFRALVKDKPESQLTYYQPGIGTYNKRQFVTRTVSTIASAIDQGFALHINDHVKEGYQYIMRNYRKGDKICLFGFSRGAHTARVVAGMLYKVGVLPAHNDQQLDFAFTVYQTTGDLGYRLSMEFKKTFAIPVTVEFVGVWDTVSSVGLIPRSQPYTSVNYAVKHFRHALALDERRARFRPNVWNEPSLEREQDLDVDEPNVTYPGEDRDAWVYEPPERNICDVEEVWFAGCHADIGGGSHANHIEDSLSHIPLRWMIKECYATNTGIKFDRGYLEGLGFNSKELAQLEEKGLDPERSGVDINTHEDIRRHPDAAQSHADPHSGVSTHIFDPWVLVKARADALAKIWDQLDMARGWWVLEFLPMLATYQQEDGTWIRRRMRNLGQGRYIPFSDDQVKVHRSVKDRIEGTQRSADQNAKRDIEPYKPQAYNWDLVNETGMLTYVD